MYKKQEIGKIGENLATKYLENKEYKVLLRNFRCRSGEIDIIAEDKNEIVFVEVKTRSILCYGRPAEAVDYFKRKHIYRTAKYFLHKNNLERHFVRFDVIEIYLSNKKYKVSHIKNVDIN